MFGTLEILILCIVAVAARQVFLRGRNRVSVLILVAFAVVLVALVGTQFAERVVRPPARGGWSTVMPVELETPPDIDFAKVSDSIKIHINGTDSTVSAENPSDQASPRIEQTDHGNMLVLPLSASILETVLGPDAAAALETLSNAVPPELRQAYALVPIPGAVGDAVPGLHALATTVAHLTETVATVPKATETTTELDKSEESLAEAPVSQRPAWLDLPNDGQIVLHGGFEETRGLSQSQLATEITQILLADAKKVVGSGSLAMNDDRRRFTMTEDAVASSVVNDFTEEVVLQVGGTPKQMFRTVALVQFPENVTLQAVQHVKQSLQNQRTWTVGAAAVSLGLFVMLAVGLLQLAGSSSRFVRWSGVPFVVLLMLPGAVMSGGLVFRVVAEENINIPSPFELPDTVVGVQSASEIHSR